MKKYLFIVLCACVAMYVAADDSLRSQVHKPQGSTIINSQDDKQEGISEAYVAASQNSVEKDQAAEKTIPDIKGGGLVPRPVRPGNQGGKSAGGIHTTELVSDAKFDVLHSEAAVQASNYTGSSETQSCPPTLSVQLSIVHDIIVGIINGGGLVPRPPYNPSWGNTDVVAYVSSRDGHSVLPPFIVPQDGILYTNSTGFVMQSSGKLLEPLGGGLVPRWPPRSGSIIPGAVVLSRGNGSGSGSLRSNAAPVMLGDVNDDGKVDVSDITSLNEYVLGNPLEAFVTEVADVNGDGIIDVGDVTALTHFVLNGTWAAE